MRQHKNYEVRVNAQLGVLEDELDYMWNREGFETRVEFVEGFQMALEAAHLGFPVEAPAKDAHEAGVQFGRTWLLNARCAKNCPKCKGKGEHSFKSKITPWEKRKIVYCQKCNGLGFEGALTSSEGIVANMTIIEALHISYPLESLK